MADNPVRLAYADPPYPGKANRYPECTEVDHAELIATLEEFDGWALSTDEVNLAYVLALCPPKTRVLAWCRPNAVPFTPFPYAAWEPVLCSPARASEECVPSFYVEGVTSGFRQRDGLTGQKPPGFCEWVIRSMGARPDDVLEDVFPGTGIMGQVWERWRASPPLFQYAPHNSGVKGQLNRLRRSHPTLPGFEPARALNERRPLSERAV